MRILAADAYDALELSSLAFGPIGAGRYEDDDAPCCIFGHAKWASDAVLYQTNPIASALKRAGIGPHMNDLAVGVGNRVSFKQWCRRLNVVRGK